MAMADTAIVVWDSKKHFNFWRPITAIHEAENDGNPATAADPSWQPFLTTPPYPDYTSGGNGVSGCDHSPPQTVLRQGRRALHGHDHRRRQSKRRATTTSFSEYAKDMVNVRIYQGLHFRFADVASRDQGKKVADVVFKNVGTPK